MKSMYIIGKVYQVGGCVRDYLLGNTPNDIDYVVVGSTEEDMLKYGFEKVGADFPVFLHPNTKDEYALARTEVKTGTGYHGFETHFGPEVTLEQDLYRRDFTMNAMAMNISLRREIVDPYNGQEDIKNKVIRAVNPDAFVEDPVRILRAARFAARYGFTVHPETVELIKSIPIEDLLDVTRERVMLELEKALKDGKGFQFFKILESFGENIFELLIGVQFNYRYHSIDELYEQIGISGVMCLLAEVDGSASFLIRNKASSDTIFLFRLIQKACQRHHFEPSDVFELIQSSDFYRRPTFLMQLDKYIKATTLNIVFIAEQMAAVGVSDIDPELKGSQIRDALNIERKKVFDSILGL